MSRTVVLGFACLLFICNAAYAHPPEKVEAEFDPEDHMLKVIVSHDVKDAGKHFIDEVGVELNGKEIISQSLLAQETLESLTLVYRITDAKPGDEIKIFAGCNVFGRKTAVVKVEEKTQKGTPQEKIEKNTLEQEAQKDVEKSTDQ